MFPTGHAARLYRQTTVLQAPLPSDCGRSATSQGLTHEYGHRDRLESRVAGLEATTEQLNTRLGRVENEIQVLREEITGFRSEMRDNHESLRGEMSDLRSEMGTGMDALRDSFRNWAIFAVVAIGTLMTLFQFVM